MVNYSWKSRLFAGDIFSWKKSVAVNSGCWKYKFSTSVEDGISFKKQKTISGDSPENHFNLHLIVPYAEISCLILRLIAYYFRGKSIIMMGVPESEVDEMKMPR